MISREASDGRQEFSVFLREVSSDFLQLVRLKSQEHSKNVEICIEDRKDENLLKSSGCRTIVK